MHNKQMSQTKLLFVKYERNKIQNSNCFTTAKRQYFYKNKYDCIMES